MTDVWYPPLGKCYSAHQALELYKWMRARRHPLADRVEVALHRTRPFLGISFQQCIYTADGIRVVTLTG